MNNPLRQSWVTLSCLQLSGALSLPMIMIGFYLGRHYSWQQSLVEIFAGNLCLFLLAAGYMRVIEVKKQVTIAFAQTLLGNKGAYWGAAGLVLSLLGWSAIQIHLLAATTGQPAGTILLSIVFIYLLTFRNFAFLTRANLLILPFLCTSLLYLLWMLPAAPTPIFFVEVQPFKIGLLMVITAGSGLVFDLPTFFRHATTLRDARLALALIFLLGLPAIQGLGLYLAQHTANQASWVAGFLSSFSLPALVFLMLSGLSGACLNLYSASMVLQRLLGYSYAKLLFVLCCLSGLLALVNLEEHFSFFLEFINLNAEIMTVLLWVYVGFKGIELPAPGRAQEKAHQIIFFMVLGYAACSAFFHRSVTHDLFIDVALISSVLMVCYYRMGEKNARARR